MNLQQQVILISAFRTGNTNYENMQATEKLGEALQQLGLNYGQAIGMYRGTREISMVVQASVELPLIELAERFGQESILVVSKGGVAELVYTDGRREQLPGKFGPVSSETARNLNAYTLVNGKFYAVVV